MLYQEPPKICPVCLEESSFRFIRNYQSKEGRFFLYECSKCNVQFWLPFRNPGANWYENQEKYRVQIPKIYRGYHKRFLKLNPTFPRNIKVLDLGCGTGEFIAELEKRGCEVWGVDSDKVDIETAKQRFGLKNLYAMLFDDFFKKINLLQFNIITSFEVIEHLDDPLNFIYEIKKLLKPNGKVVLSTPSRERIMANAYEWDFPLHHLTRWNEKAIKKLLQKAGFKVISVNYVDQFRHLFELFAGKIRMNLLNKTGRALRMDKKNVGRREDNNKFKGDMKRVFIKLIHTGGYLKDYIFAGIPAGFFWLMSKILRINNGVMVIELKLKK